MPSVLREMPIGKIRPDPRNERRRLGDIKGLATTIRHVGVIEPVVARRLKGTDECQIVSGERRYRAAKAAGAKTLSVILKDGDSGWQQDAERLIANIQREDLNPIEVAYALKRLLDGLPGGNGSQKKLALFLGKDKSWVSGFLRILDLQPKLHRKIEAVDRKISYDSLIRVARIKDPHEQEKLVDNLVSGATTKEIRRQILRSPHSAESLASRLRTQREIDVGNGSLVVIKSHHKMNRQSMIKLLEIALKQMKQG